MYLLYRDRGQAFLSIYLRVSCGSDKSDVAVLCFPCKALRTAMYKYYIKVYHYCYYFNSNIVLNYYFLNVNEFNESFN